MFVTDPELFASINPRVRKSPFWDRTVRLGLTHVTAYNHMWLPMSYGDLDAEYERLTESVALWDVSAQRHIEVSGPDANRFVSYTSAIDTTAIAPGTSRYAPMLDRRGLIINDPVLLRFDDGSWRFSIADGDVGLWLRAIADVGSFEVEVAELQTSTIAVQGPASGRVAEELGLDLSALDDHAHVHVELDGDSAVFSNSGWSGQTGFELFIDEPDHAVPLWDRIVQAGEGFGIGPGAPNQAERIEAGLLSYGTDTGYDATPLELGLESIIDVDGEDFIGRSALRSMRDEEVERRLVRCAIDGNRCDGVGHPIPIGDGDEEQVRAVAFSPGTDRNLGVALVSSSRPPGDEVIVRFPDGDRRITIEDDFLRQ